MKKILFPVFASLVLSLSACGGSHDHEKTGHSDQMESKQDAAHGEGKEYTSAYICPMHCEGSGSDSPGKCPACGMDYVAQSEHTHDGHTH